MATLSTLESAGHIKRLSIVLDHDEHIERGLFGVPAFLDWAEVELMKAEKSPLRHHENIADQLEGIFHRFITGQRLKFKTEYHVLEPGENGVWELKTPDIRIFGWFALKNHFISVFGDRADRVKDHRLYAGYRNEVARIRRDLGCDELCVWEKGECDVISL